MRNTFMNFRNQGFNLQPGVALNVLRYIYSDFLPFEDTSFKTFQLNLCRLYVAFIQE